MDNLYMPKAEDGYHLFVLAREHLSGWEEAQPLTQGMLEKVADMVYQDGICLFGILENVVVDRGAENKKWTELLLLKHYNILQITVIS
jgi:hypothetical protein